MERVGEVAGSGGEGVRRVGPVVGSSGKGGGSSAMWCGFISLVGGGLQIFRRKPELCFTLGSEPVPYVPRARGGVMV